MHEIRIPRLGWSMEEGTFVGWRKQPGDHVAVGETLFELEGEKALQEIEAVDAGILYLPSDSPRPGSVVPVGTRLGYLLAPGEAPPGSALAVTPPPTQSREVSPPESPPAAGPSVRRLARELGVNLSSVTGTGKAGRITKEDVTAHVSPAIPTTTTCVVATPRAKRIARELQVDWTRLSGTGRDGRIREADVRAAAQQPRTSSLPSIPLSPRRKAIAERLRYSQQQTIPVTLTTTLNATHLVSLREQFKSQGAALVPAYTDIVACLVAGVLKKHPRMAIRWNPENRALITIPIEEFHLGIAVDTPDGLLVPVVRDVLGKSLMAVTRESKALIEKARSGRLTGNDVGDSVITITNLGAYGIEGFTPIINYPEIAILGLGAIRREAVVLSDDRIVPQDRLTLSLTFDHAAVDGAPAAAFLRDVVAAIETPAAHLLGESSCRGNH